MTSASFEATELKLLADTVLHQYGYDFRGYAEASFRRRIQRAVTKYGCGDITGLLARVAAEPEFFSRLLGDLTVTVTECFRDPPVYRALRDHVFPYLRTYPEFKIWFAGCAGGEEVYSLAILLQEEGLFERAMLYGTDINPVALKRAKEGIVSLEALRDANHRYLEIGGKRTLSTYYSTGYGAALFDASLRTRMVFSDHNLVSDGVFSEMQLILCRNTLIYFKRDLNDRAIGLFRESLCPGGFLCLGTKESLLLSSQRDAFEEFARAERIYRRRREA